MGAMGKKKKKTLKVLIRPLLREEKKWIRDDIHIIRRRKKSDGGRKKTDEVKHDKVHWHACNVMVVTSVYIAVSSKASSQVMYSLRVKPLGAIVG